MNLRPFNIKPLFAGCYFCIFIFPAIAQTKVKPLIWVERMEYIYDHENVGSYNQQVNTQRVILPADTIVAGQMKQSVVKAIGSRWDAEIQNIQWQLKELVSFKSTPKFKPKLKSNQQDSWHLFFQVFDTGPYPIISTNSFYGTHLSFESLDTAPYNLQIKATMLDGTTGAIIFSHEMNVAMLRTVLPDSQMLLRKVPGLTSSFIKAFDSAVRVFFDTIPVSLLKLPLVPAFVFFKADSILPKVVPLIFKVTGDSMIEEQAIGQSWVIQKMNIQKLGKKSNFGNNFFGGSLTILTGIRSDKVKEWRYLASFGFKEMGDNKQYTCYVPYIKEELEERSREKIKEPDGSKSYTTNLDGKTRGRIFVDPEHDAYLLEGADTVGSFQVTFGKEKTFIDRFTQCWDGRDSSSITDMPEYWNNNIDGANMLTAPLFLKGTLYNEPFVIQSSKAGNQLDLMANGELLATISMNNYGPSKGLLFSQPADKKVLNVLLMLSSLRLSYFN